MCSTVDYQPPKPETVEEEEEEPDPLEPEACFTDSMNHLHLIYTVSVTNETIFRCFAERGQVRKRRHWPSVEDEKTGRQN